MRRRVVITGIGPVSPIGHGSAAFAEALVAGRCGLGLIESFDASGFPCRVGGECKDIDARQAVPKAYRKATKVMARDTELAVVAARFAVLDSGLTTRDEEGTAGGFVIDPKRVGCQIGAGFIAAEIDEIARAIVSSQGEGQGGWDLKRWGTENGGDGAMNNLPPLWLLKYLPNMLACHVTIVHGFEGPSNTITCAEASALLSIGEGARVIERDNADLCVSGGAESKMNLMGLMRFDLAGRMAHSGDETDPSRIARPFEADSPGGVLGEGGGLVVLEEASHAKERGAGVYAEVAGFGSGQTPNPYLPGIFDGPAPGEPEPGQLRAIRAALDDAGLAPSEIDAVIPLGVGVPTLDSSEMAALGEVFGERMPPRVTITERVGDCLAGHGALAVCAGATMIRDGVWPAGTVTADGEPPSGEGPRAILITTHAIGGPCAAVVLKKSE
ncbi:MAG: 3-oxoacyl-[acyl-carrier-protein] synthase II [Phycisphaerales bacterium]|jgi:3-oxoacyl-[acyl-carrier-protein] synthase II